MYKSTFALIIGLLIVVTSTHAQESSWGWKKATDPNDVMNFLNSKTPYKKKIDNFEITAVNKGNYIEFIVFYRSDKTATAIGVWGWKKATDSNDVIDFLSCKGAYNRPVKEAKVVAIEKENYTEYYVFYKRGLKETSLHTKSMMNQQ